MIDRELLKRFFNALPERAEGGADVSSIYVRRAPDDAHDPVQNIREYIAWDQPGSTYLFSGLRGSGKTTELNRLIAELRDDGVEAFYCDASAYLNLNDPQLTLPELLLTVLAGLSDAVRQRYGKDFLKDTESIWQRTRRFFASNVELKPTLKAEAGGVGVEIEATLQENPDFRNELNKFARSSSQFFDEARKFAAALAELIQQRGQCERIVMVVDSLERLSAPTGAESTLFDSLKEVFFNNPAQLQFPAFSVVYSAPPYLHAVLPGVSSGFTQSFALPNFKVMQRPKESDTCCQRNQQGIDQMVEIVQRRFPEWRNALSQPVVEHLAWMSGGNVRRYFSLICTTLMKTALGGNPLPLAMADDSPVRQAIAKAAEPLQWLTAEDRRWLDLFMTHSDNPSGHIKDLVQDLPAIIRLFDHSLVLDYQNGSVWYQVPPLVRDYV
jgi:hypothetical protein